MMRGDHEVRLLVDRTLSQIYRSGDIEAIFVTAFGGLAAPSEVIEIMYRINSLAD